MMSDLGTDCDSCDSPVTVVTDYRIVGDATNGDANNAETQLAEGNRLYEVGQHRNRGAFTDHDAPAIQQVF